MTAYTKPVTPRRMAKGTEQIAFPRGESRPPPRGVRLDDVVAFHLEHDGTKPGGAA